MSLTEAIVGSMKWYTGHTFTHVFNNNYNVAMLGLKILFNHTVQWRCFHIIDLYECSIRVYLIIKANYTGELMFTL